MSQDVVTGTRWRWEVCGNNPSGDWVQDPHGTHVAHMVGGRIVLRQVQLREVAA